MPKKIQDKIKKALYAPPRFHNNVYEKRVMICGIKIEASAADLSSCEEKFLKALAERFSLICEAISEKPHTSMGPQEKVSPIRRDIAFTEWADLWFTEIFQNGVIPYTYDRERKTFFRHVVPFFKNFKLRDITPLDCTRFFNRLKEQGIERTAETCYGHLKRIFLFAVENDILPKSPMATMKPIKHRRMGGIPLTKEEELLLLSAAQNTPYEAAILLGLYVGLRPCEIPTAHIEENFIVAENRKQKDQSKKVYKKIPITPMSEPYRDLLISQLPLQNFSQNSYNSIIKHALPNHRPYDLRDTFATRAQECGVLEQVVQIFMGHVPSTLLGKVYTKFSDEFLYMEGLKIKY